MRGGIVPVLMSSGELPLALYDFTSGDVSGLQFGTAVAGADSRDSLTYVPANSQRRTSLGLLVERQATNKNTNTNLKPTDTSGTNPQANWTTHKVVERSLLRQDVLDALNAIDPQGNVTAVYNSISNSSGGAIAFGGSTGNTNPHTNSLWQYVISGACGPSASAQLGPFYGPEGWQRKEFSFTPLSAGDSASLSAQSAAEVYWFGNQLEEGDANANARSSLIEISGATATRLEDRVSTSLPNGFNQSSWTIAYSFEQYVNPPVGVFPRAMEISDAGTTTRVSGLITDSTFLQRADLVPSGGISGPVMPLDTVVNHAIGYEGTNIGFSIDGSDQGTTLFTPTAAYTVLRFGSASSGSQLNGYVRVLSVWDLPGTAENRNRLSEGFS